MASIYNNRGHGLRPADGLKLPEVSSTADPGSSGKILAMMERARLGLELNHPDDRKQEPEESSTPYVIPGARTGGLRGDFNRSITSEE